jgi:chromosome segregation ATPase
MTMESRKQLIEKLDAQLKEYNAKIAVWEAKAEKAALNAKYELKETLDQLRKKQETMRTSLSNLKGASDSAWEEIKKGVDHAWTDLKAAVDQAARKL